MGQRLPIDPDEQLELAKSLARKHNMFLVCRGEHYQLYRRTIPRPTFLGKRSTPAAIEALVAKCAAHR